MKKIILIILSISIIGLSPSCDVMQQVANDVMTQNTPLSSSEVSKGLKKALEIGTDKAVNGLHNPNSFLTNMAYKIYLPKEAKIITENKDNQLLKAIGVSKMINDVEQSMNMAAANAVNAAKPIFINAITNMSISDAFGILKGGDNAATDFLYKTTYQSLYNSFKPQIAKSLNKKLYQGISANNAWTTLTSSYNKVANYVPGWNSVNTELDDYVTKKALTALFSEIKKEEANIRKNPSARVTSLLKRVFANQ